MNVILAPFTSFEFWVLLTIGFPTFILLLSVLEITRKDKEVMKKKPNQTTSAQELLKSLPHDLATSDQGREQQIAALAYDAVEERIRNGTASAMELVYFLKLGSQNARLEREKLESEVRLQEAKIKNLEASARTDEAYDRVIAAMKSYVIDDGEE